VAERDLYDVLGVSRDATQEEIRKAYRALARAHHPDVNHEDPQAEHRFKEINLAYQTLSDPARRRQYDAFGGEGFTPDMFGFMGDIGDIFEAFFGSPFGRPRTRTRTRTRRGADLRMLLDLTFEEAVFGSRKEIEIEKLDRCERCGGTGCEPGTHASRCTACGGAGEVSDVRRSVFGTVMTSRGCPRCEGTGQEIASPCRECRGDGRLPSRRSIPVEVPAGVADGMDLRIEGAGQEGRQGGGAGDLYLTIRVAPHPVLMRRGQDLVCGIDLPVTTALLGGQVVIETLDGPETVKVAPGTRAGDVLRLRGRGVPHLGRRSRGDLLVRVDLDVPKKLSRAERTAVEEWARSRGEDGRGPAPGRLRPLS
jgi:molecular chaperone DnaJ